jgi:hypothetical protein
MNSAHCELGLQPVGPRSRVADLYLHLVPRYLCGKPSPKITNPNSALFFQSRAVMASHARSRRVTQFPEKKDCLFFYALPKSNPSRNSSPLSVPSGGRPRGPFQRFLETLFFYFMHHLEKISRKPSCHPALLWHIDGVKFPKQNSATRKL